MHPLATLAVASGFVPHPSREPYGVGRSDALVAFRLPLPDDSGIGTDTTDREQAIASCDRSPFESAHTEIDPISAE